MNYPDWWSEAEPEIHRVVENFVNWLRGKVAEIKPNDLVEKNPFLFRARDAATVGDLSDRLIDAFVSSSEETKFGGYLEEIAIIICQHTKGGWKSTAQGIDLEFDEGDTRSIIQIKSGRKWGNSSQHKKMQEDFRKGSIVARQGRIVGYVRSVEGICYGPSQTTDKGTYHRIVGNDFWEYISGWNCSGKAVMSLIGDHAGNGLSDVRETARGNIVEYLKQIGVSEPNGEIKWEIFYDLVMAPPRMRPKPKK